FMAQKGRIVVCGDAAEAFGDSMYQGELFCGGEIADPGSDTVVEEPSAEEAAWLSETLEPLSLGPKREWKKGRSGGKLWRYAKKALGRAASIVGTSTTTGDGGMHHRERAASKTLVYQVTPSHYGNNPHDMQQADAVEIVIGQGAKPGTGGVLLGFKVSDEVAE